jgi:hypothetical protein
MQKQKCIEHEKTAGKEIQIAPGSGTSPVPQKK